MAFKIIWSELACQDLRDIVEFIARDNRQVAEAFGFLLISKVDSLSRFPRMGRVVPEIEDDAFREIIFRSYRIIYHVEDAQHAIAVIRIWHGARGEPEIL